jgi:hypothetical protein
MARGKQAPILLESLDSVAGWQSWTALRQDAGRTVTQAEQVMAYTVTVLLH